MNLSQKERRGVLAAFSSLALLKVGELRAQSTRDVARLGSSLWWLELELALSRPRRQELIEPTVPPRLDRNGCPDHKTVSKPPRKYGLNGSIPIFLHFHIFIIICQAFVMPSGK